MLLVYLLLALGISFLCSLFEAVILSISPAYAMSLLKDGKRSGKLVQKLKSEVEHSLTAILTLNTIAHTVGAVGVGAEVLRLYGDDYVAIGSVVLTLLVLVLSEIIPKSLGANYWRTLAPYVAYGIQLFIYLAYPIVASFELFKKLFLKGEASVHPISREEILYAAEMSNRQGALGDEEIEVIKNVLRLGSITVTDIMTPRTVVLALDEGMTVAQVQEKHPSLPFSRLPIYEEQVDRFTGMVMRFELLEKLGKGEGNTKLSEIRHPLHAVPPVLRVSDALQEFLKRQEHIFAVVDEHGGFSGIVTLEDCLETLLGLEIVDESDSVEDMRKLAREKWSKRRQRYDPSS